MSQRTGDKSRFNRVRKANLRMRTHLRKLRKAIEERAAAADQKKESTTKDA
jgi:hypothetical protein